MMNDDDKNTTDSPHSLASLKDVNGVETGSVVELRPGPHLLALPASQEGGSQLHGEAWLEPMSPKTVDDIQAVLENYLLLGGKLKLLSSGRQSPPPSLLLRYLPSLLQADESGQQEGNHVKVQVPAHGQEVQGEILLSEVITVSDQQPHQTVQIFLVETEVASSLASDLCYGGQQPLHPWFCPAQLQPLLSLVCCVGRAHQDRHGVPNASLPHQQAPWPCFQPAASSPPPHLAWFNTCWRGSNTPLVEVDQADI